MSYFKTAYKNCFLLLLFIIFSCSVFSQIKSTVVPKLNTNGLANEKFIRSIFTGDFAAIDFDRDEPGFSLTLDAYINAYWNKCGTSLPNDKVEITYQECVRWVEHRTTGYFGTTVKKDCLEWDTHHTNVYASPAMYAAKTTVDALLANDDLRNIFIILQQKNPIGTIGDYTQQAVILKQDMNSFFSMNDCKSAGMKRFEQNLYSFAMNKLPIVLEGSQIPRADPNVLLKDQNFGKLINDLILAQSAKWAINKYVPNRVTDETIVSKDGKGRPATITANYPYLLGRQEIDGSVKLTFMEGLPNCLYFFDNPTTCRTANRKIVLNYATGRYINADTLYKMSTTFYTVDKKDSNWVVKFKDGVDVKLYHPNLYFDHLFTKSGEELIIKPGQWAIITGRANDFVHVKEFNVDHRPKPMPDPDGKIPEYSIDKTTYPNYWMVRFYNNWLVRIQPGERFNGGATPDFSIILKPGQYVERENVDYSFTLLKDLDRRNGNFPPYTVDKTTRPNLWIVEFNTSMDIRVSPTRNGQFYSVQAGSGHQLKPGQYLERKNQDGSITLLKDLDHR